MTKIHVEQEETFDAIVVTAYVGDDKVREVIAHTDEEETAEDIAAMKLLKRCDTVKAFDAVCREYMIPVLTF